MQWSHYQVSIATYQLEMYTFSVTWSSRALDSNQIALPPDGAEFPQKWLFWMMAVVLSTVVPVVTTLS